jgi:excisionase family DNA binding protein
MSYTTTTDLLTISEIAEAMDVKEATIKNWVYNDRVPFYRLDDKKTRLRLSEVVEALKVFPPYVNVTPENMKEAQLLEIKNYIRIDGGKRAYMTSRGFNVLKDKLKKTQSVAKEQPELLNDIKLISGAELAEHLSTSLTTVKNLAFTGKIRYYQLGGVIKFNLNEVLEDLVVYPATLPLPKDEQEKNNVLVLEAKGFVKVFEKGNRTNIILTKKGLKKLIEANQ